MRLTVQCWLCGCMEGHIAPCPNIGQDDPPRDNPPELAGFRSREELDAWMASQPVKSWPLRFEGKLYWWDEPTINGADIRKLVEEDRGRGSDYALMQAAEPWWEAVAISDATAVDLRTPTPLEFYLVPPARM